MIELSETETDTIPIIIVHIFKSLTRLSIGFVLATVLGVPLGILTGMNKFFHTMINPIISLLMPLPTIAWVPILLIWSGIGDKTIIIAVFLGAFFVIIYNTNIGIKNIDQKLVWSTQIMGADKSTIFFKILLPGSLSSIITGLRLGIGYSWRALVGAEMLAAAEWGLGYLVFASKTFLKINVMFASILIIMIIGTIMENLIMGLIRKKTIEKWGMMLTQV
jgi:NitT/TauT family transport system permease protein